MVEQLDINGVQVFPAALDLQAQQAWVADLRDVVTHAPQRQWETPGGRKMSVRMTAAGQFGWVSDRKGYRYDPVQPDGRAWPAIPDRILALWQELLPKARLPECCLVNYYAEATKMGLHQDRDEGDFDQPVLSISLGDEALFRVGGQDRRDRTKSVWLRSGDVAILQGPSRLAYHGIDRIKFGSSPLLKDGGRLNITLRVVT